MSNATSGKSTTAPGGGRTALTAPPSMFGKLYTIAGGLLIGGFVFAWLTGWDFDRSEKDFVPGSARTSPGGYRSFHFWHSGYSGGK